jgi:hypothetical protein
VRPRFLSRDGQWQAELEPKGWTLTHPDNVVFRRANLHTLIGYLRAHGFDPRGNPFAD